MDEIYLNQSRLVLRILPLIKEYSCFCLKGEPLWDLHPCMHIKDLPTVRWKLENILRMEGMKKKEAFNKLEDVLYGEHS